MTLRTWPLLLLPLLGCPGPEDMPADMLGAADLSVVSTDGPAPVLGPYDACISYYQAFFARFEACGTAIYAIDLPRYTQYLCTRYRRRVEDDHTSTYQQASYAGCLGAIQGAPCASTQLLSLLRPDQCGLFAGTKAPGASCLDEIECSGESYCDTGACPGTCRGYLAAGANCTTGQCKTGLYCNRAPMQPVCAQLPSKGQTCGNGSQCDAGLYCSQTTCQDQKQTGQCLQNNECTAGSRCRGATPPNIKGECVAYKRRLEGCATDDDCTFGLLCTDGLCDVWPKTGGACGTLPGHTRSALCLASWCNAAAGMAGKCVAQLPLNTVCDSMRSDQCAPDTICTAGRCVATQCFSYR